MKAMNIQMCFRAITHFFLMSLLLNKLHEVNYIFKQYIYIYRERERERESWVQVNNITLNNVTPLNIF